VGKKVNILIGLALFLLGGFVGVTVMCLVQVGGAADKEASDLYEVTKRENDLIGVTEEEK